jgi:hypothetical protein
MIKKYKQEKWMKGSKCNWFKDSDRDGVVNIFDCQPHNRRKQGWAHQGHVMNRERSTHIRMMTPDKFLRTTQRETSQKNFTAVDSMFDNPNAPLKSYTDRVVSQPNVERLKKVIRSRQGKMEIPYLEYDEQGRPTGHEGRHRAMASKQMGVKLIPVTISRELKEPRDWRNIRKGMIDGKHYRGMGTKPTKKDWRNDLENEDEITSSASADIPIQEQREYGKEKLSALKELSAQELIDEK